MKIDKIKIKNTIYDIHGPATAEEYGLIKLGYISSNKNYAVELDSSGNAYVYVPWTNTTYTLSGLMGSTAKGSSTQPIYWNGSQFVSTTYSLNKTVPADAVFTDTTYGVATANNLGLIKLGYQPEQGSKNYPVVVDANNKAYVNVPWDDTDTQYTLQAATTTALGGIIVSAVGQSQQQVEDTTSSTTHHYYGVQVDSAGKAYVDVPWVASQGGGGTAAGFDSLSVGNTTISSSVQSDLYISSHGGTSVTVDQGISSLADKSVVYIDINAATNTHYGGIKIDTQSIVTDPTAGNYPVQLTSGANSGFAYVSVPQQTLASLIGSNAIGNSTSFIYWDGSGFVSQAVPTGSGQMAISADPTLSNNTLQAAPNTLYRFTNPVSALAIQLQQPSTSNVAVEYLFRFKTASSGVNITFTDSQDQTTDILYPFDYILNTDTEYEISVLYDGSKYLVRNCAYQSNT